MTIHELFVYLRVADAARAIAFYKEAFGATEKFRLTEPSGRIGHCELGFGDTIVMLSDPFPELGFVPPEPGVPRSATIHLHVDDADGWIDRLCTAGCELLRPPSDAFYGERSGTVRDPFGHEWMIGHSIEEVTPEEMQRRYTALLTSS